MPTRCEQQWAYRWTLVGLELLRWYHTARVMLGRYWSDVEAGESFQGGQNTNTRVETAVSWLIAV